MTGDELRLIFEVIEKDGLSDAGRDRLESFLEAPPPLDGCLEVLAGCSLELRHGLLFALMDVAVADGFIDPAEEKVLQQVQKRLGITDAQRQAIETFSRAAKQVTARGRDDTLAAETLKNASAGLAAVGVPITALYFSGSVIGLSAAGVTSGLAALGLGLGMVPGIGVIVVIGVVAFYGFKRLVGGGTQRRQSREGAERERRAQLVIQNLHNAVRHLTLRIVELEESVERSAQNRAAIIALTEKLQRLQEVIRARKVAAA
jgi:hypothetical protein